MGREAYLMRLALGRSALEPPEEPNTPEDAQEGETIAGTESSARPRPPDEVPSDLSQPPPDTQLYDARGHPFNPWARSQSRKLREAQNDILSVIGVTERKIPVVDGVSLGPGHEAQSDEDEAGDIIANAADFEYQFLSWWVHALTNRFLVFPSTADVSFRDATKLHWDALGWRDFIFGGLGSFMFGHVVSPEIWAGKIMYLLDRAVLANVREKKWREVYDRLSPYIAGGVEVAMNIFILPFRLHSMLQLLGFEPQSTWLGLPHPRSWLPFSAGSFIRLDSDILPILPFFMFRPISSLVHQYMHMSLRPAIMGPLDIGHRRRSSSSRYASSVNSAPLLELPTDPTYLTPVFQRVFSFLRWAPPSLSTNEPEDTSFRNPGLRRQETWPVQHTHQIHPDASHVITDEPPPEVPATDPPVEASTTPPSTPPRTLTRSLTVATLDETSPPTLPTDASIRISSFDPERGVDLEIALPEDYIEHEEQVVVDNGRTVNYISTTDSSTAALRRERRERELYYGRPHRVSRLSVEPAEMLAGLCDGWVSGWVLLPLRAVVLRNLVAFVLEKPEIFGISRIRALELPPLLGSSSSPGTSWALTGAKHIALSCMLDVVLGLTYWLSEWSIVRYVGVDFFNWGKF